MDFICPVCNGLKKIENQCPSCQCIMSEKGSLMQYLGPYSPYEEIEILEQNNGILEEGPDPCVHLLYCHCCDLEQRVLIEKVSI